MQNENWVGISEKEGNDVNVAEVKSLKLGLELVAIPCGLWKHTCVSTLEIRLRWLKSDDTRQPSANTAAEDSIVLLQSFFCELSHTFSLFLAQLQPTRVSTQHNVGVQEVATK